MNIFLLLVTLACAATAPAAEFVPGRREPNWLKAYPVTPFREFWTGDLQVKALDKAVPAIVALVEKSGASLTQGLDSYISSDKSKQLSISIPQKKAKEFLKALQKQGVMEEPRTQQGLPRPNADELRAKIDRLIKERVTKKAALAEVPATAEASEEILEQLLNAEALAKKTEDAVLLNLTVRETP
jgi:hypothetical protein